MHAVHCILVDLESANVVIDEREATLDKLADQNGKEPDYVSELRNYADLKTEEYRNDIFDWRETKSAGRWSEEYPCNVVTGKLERGRFLELFEEFSVQPEDEAKDYIRRFIQENNGETLTLAFENLAKLDSMQTFRLKQAIRLLNGDYTFDAHFYSVFHCGSRLSKNEKQEVCDYPENFALVFFDCHN